MIKFRGNYYDFYYDIISIDFQKEEAIGLINNERQYFSLNELEISLDNGQTWNSFVNFEKEEKFIER